MHLHWENNKDRETTIATHIKGIQFFLENHAQTNFFKSTFSFNLNLYMQQHHIYFCKYMSYWSIRQNPIFQRKGVFASFKERIFHMCCNRVRKNLRVAWRMWLIIRVYITWNVCLRSCREKRCACGVWIWQRRTLLHIRVYITRIIC